MEVDALEDPAEFATAVEAVLAADPVRHTITLTALDAITRGGAPVNLMLLVREGARVVGAALRSPGRHLLVEALPEHLVAHLAGPVADVVARVDPDTCGVSGPVAVAEAVGEALAARVGARTVVQTRSRLFRLDELVAPPAVPGAARLARAGRAGDVDLLAAWRDAFAREAHVDGELPVDSTAEVRRSLRLGSAEVLWEVGDVAVAQASARPVLAGASRIGPVYTAPRYRRNGYAAAVTAAATRWALDAGAVRVLLFTDLANPTTNALYPRIGYRPVHDTVDVGLVRG